MSKKEDFYVKNEIDASIAIQVLPSVQENDEIVGIVDEVIAYIKSKNLNTHVGPFETTIEGEIWRTYGHCEGMPAYSCKSWSARSHVLCKNKL